MKFKLIIPGMLILSLGMFSCKKDNSKSPANPKLKDQIDSVSYALGSLVGQDLKSGGFKELDYRILNAALKRALNGDSLTMDKMQATMILQTYAMAEMKKKAKENEKTSEEFLARNKAKAGVITTSSGLQYKVISNGTGPKPAPGQKVKVNYTGKLIDGKVFDSSVQRGQPAEFNVSEVIPGWTEALTMMNVGSKWELYIPPKLGYGEQGNQSIPGNSVLIFEVELLGVMADMNPPAEEAPKK